MKEKNNYMGVYVIVYVTCEEETTRLRIRNRIRRYFFRYYPFLVGVLTAITFHLSIIWCGGKGELPFSHD